MGGAERLPNFAYHPDPIQTGYIVRSSNVCRSCGIARGLVYTGVPYADEELENTLCPWCIADGSAAERFDAEFADARDLETAGVSPDVIDEILHRTPGYTSWQTSRWLSHCGDACEFHGDLPKERLAMLTEQDKASILADLPDDAKWEILVNSYEPAGQPAIYWFICRHCGQNLYYADYT